jgi:glycosyltransferase involved in cell wall biosynthesis
MVDRGSPLVFPADELVPTATYVRDLQWQESTRDRILSTWTHGLLEAGRPLMGVMYGRTFAADARLMEQAGVKVGLVFHGSELRDPRRHAAAHRWSPFRDTTDPWVQRVQATVDLLRPDIDAFTGPCLVSTPDLLKELRRATWLPVVVDCEVWVPRQERPEPVVPVVVHTPSRAAIKGSAFVDEALAPLVAEGLVEYRRVEGVPPQQMPAVLGDADIVLDQFAIGSYGVLACQAMATGTAVVGHVGPEVRSAVEGATGHVLPIIEATPDTLQETLRQLVASPELRRAAAQAGPAFVRSVHDGKLSARILAEVLGIDPGVNAG